MTLTKDEVKERLAKMSEACDLLPDEFEILGADIIIAGLNDSPGIFVTRNKFDGADYTALAEFAKCAGYDCLETRKNESANCYYTDVYCPNGVVIHGLNRGKVIEDV